MLQFAFGRLAHRLIVACLLGALLSLFLLWFAVQGGERHAGLGVVATSLQNVVPTRACQSVGSVLPGLQKLGNAFVGGGFRVIVG